MALADVEALPVGGHFGAALGNGEHCAALADAAGARHHRAVRRIGGREGKLRHAQVRQSVPDGLPGIAAIALTLGMAIDANVLINERIREELRNGSSPQAAIHTGYERAFGTILDSNITTLIAGIALLIFGSGPVRGFVVVHCLGILTFLFSAVVVSRAMINLIYGRRRKVELLAIGQVWKPANVGAAEIK